MKQHNPEAQARFQQWLSEHIYCFGCGWRYDGSWGASAGRFALHAHHIPRGVHREKALYELSAILRLCNVCHDGRFDGMPVVRQLAYKKLRDPEHYDRVRVNELRGRQSDAVTEAEVDAEVALMQEG